MIPSTLITHSPDRSLRDDDWRDRAACVEDPELFYIPGDSWERHREQRAEALAMCASCPVLKQCREWMLNGWALRDPHAVIAGTTPSMRNNLRWPSRRGRRRK